MRLSFFHSRPSICSEFLKKSQLSREPSTRGPWVAGGATCGTILRGSLPVATNSHWAIIYLAHQLSNPPPQSGSFPRIIIITFLDSQEMILRMRWACSSLAWTVVIMALCHEAGAFGPAALLLPGGLRCCSKPPLLSFRSRELRPRGLVMKMSLANTTLNVPVDVRELESTTPPLPHRSTTSSGYRSETRTWPDFQYTSSAERRSCAVQWSRDIFERSLAEQEVCFFVIHICVECMATCREVTLYTHTPRRQA